MGDVDIVDCAVDESLDASELLLSDLPIKLDSEEVRNPRLNSVLNGGNSRNLLPCRKRGKGVTRTSSAAL